MEEVVMAVLLMITQDVLMTVGQIWMITMILLMMIIEVVLMTM